MLRKIRITLAAFSFTALTLLFLDFTGTLSPLFGWLAKVQLLPALLALNVLVVVMLLVLTLVFGRIYCSVVCPLGVLQDVFGWMGKKARKNRYTYSAARQSLRVLVFTFFLISLVLGGGLIVQLLAPYSAFGRIATSLLQPVYMAANNVLASLAERYDSYAFYHTDVWLRSLSSLAVAAATLAVLAVLAWRNGRTWCNTICPVGTLLGCLARFSWLKVRFDADKCKSCSLCTKNCKASCIDFKSHTVDYSRCVACGDCIDSCKFGALSFTPGPLRSHVSPAERPGAVAASAASASATSPSAAPSADGRRSFLLATALAATAAMAQEKKHVDGGLAELVGKKAPERQTPVVPPGAQSLRNIQTRCTGCQLCVSECPNGVLRPGTDLMHLFQPVMDFDRGYCRPECTRCSEVCPTGAIKPVDAVEKSSIQTGHAVVSASHCLSAIGETECGNCARHCPAGAIEMVPIDPSDDLSPSVPAVNESACIGCGACEYLCPVRPLSAIHVEGHEVHRTI